MMMKEDIVKQIIKDVGGSENINNAWHCMTRLRFDLKDEKKVDYTALEKIPKSGGNETSKQSAPSGDRYRCSGLLCSISQRTWFG